MDREKSSRRSRDDRDHHHKEDRHHRSSKDDRHHRSKDYSHDYVEQSKRERSTEPRIGREGSKDRDRDRDRERSHREESVERRHRSHDYEDLKRERSAEPRAGREGSRDRERERSHREESVERRHRSHGTHKRKERGESEERLDKSEKRRKEEKREKRRVEDKDLDEGRVLNGDIKEETREESEEQVEDDNVGSSRNGRRDRRKVGDRVMEEVDEEDKYNGLDLKYEKREAGDERGSSHRKEKRKIGDRAYELDEEEDKHRNSDVTYEKKETGDERGSSRRREKRKFGDRATEGDGEEDKERGLDGRFEKKETGDERGSSHRREKRRFGDRVDGGRDDDGHHGLDVKSENKEFSEDGGASNRRSSNGVGATSLEPGNITSKVVSEFPSDSVHPPPTKVSSISTTNENKGVSVTRSHEVPEKSSTDGTTPSVAGKCGNVTRDALAKAKKALQMQKELQEKMKKIPLLNKVPQSNSDGTQNSNSDGTQQVRLNKERSQVSSSSLGTPAVSTLPATTSTSLVTSSGVPSFARLASTNIEAVKRAQELAASMGFRHDPDFAPVINTFTGQIPPDVTLHQKPSKAPALHLDKFGNAIDEHGNVINLSKPTELSTLKVNINKQKKEAFQILKPDLNVDPESNPHFDERMGIDMGKLLRPKRMSFQFVEEGKWSKMAEITRLRSQFGEAQAKELKAKQAQLAKAKAEPDINPNMIELSERIITKEKPKDPIPDVEWWDVPLLRSGKYDVTDDKTNEDNLNMEKITIYVEHPLPIEPPAEPAPPPPQPLKLTKKEQKKLRTQRRLAKEKDRQEMIRQGLIEPPKAKVKMSNLMKVLGSEATQDPTRLEMEIRSAAIEREQAHVDRNIARKLTPAERREKKERKLFEDPSTLETIVSVYKVNDLSHPQTRFKVDVNAQENRLTGCVVITEGMSVVVVEGGSKPIKRYGKLMLRRINWAAAVADDNDEDENEDKPANKCVLVWQGSVAKPSFHKFLVHQCRTEAAARKVFSDAGVAHYWDLSVNYTDDQ